MFSPSDTIVAIATAPVRAGIGVVRISGPQAHAVARAILTFRQDLEPRRATLTHVRGADQLEPGVFRARGEAAGQVEPGAFRPWESVVIDEVVATYFPAPHSYTTEDVIEIAAHGSPALLRDVLRAAVAAGARLAEPGEFTLRAFLGGRLDLVQAEAVADLVDAVTPLQARVAFDQLEGTLTRAIGALDRELFDLAASLEASVDFPDEGYHFIERGAAAAALRRVLTGVESLLRTAASGRVVREGRHIAILGKPNVGKSSLFNALVGMDRAIVTEWPGTTRDMLTETIDLDGIRLGLVDTAGIRASGDAIEREGVSRARRAGEVADLVVLVLDGSQPLEEIDAGLLQDTAAAARVVVVNKSDLPAAWDIKKIGAARRFRHAGGEPVVALSLKTGEGLGAVRAAMRAALDVQDLPRDAPIVSNIRHEALLREARESIARALASAEAAGEPASEELLLADLRDARRALEEVTGRRTTDDVLRAIFERFCVGK